MPDSHDPTDARPARRCTFGDFRLDFAAERLSRGGEVVFLRPKTWSVLRELVARPGCVVTHRELLDRVWPGTAVTPNVLTNVIGELRAALDDRGSPARYVETVHRRGYRFVAEVRPDDGRDAPPSGGERETRRLPAGGEGDARGPIFVGRDAELEVLRARWRRVESGERQVALVSGDPGVGKSTLVEAFVSRVLDRAGAKAKLVVARARCIEGQGASEPYLPLLDALEQVGASVGRARLAAALRKYAPAWLAHMPWLTSPAEVQALWKSLLGSGEGRMAREGSRVVEELAKPRPLVLILEDLHWSDLPTLDVLTALAARSAAARLLVVATYRPVDALVAGHPIVGVARSLRQHEHVFELPLAPFATRELQAYVERRFASRAVATRLVPALEQQSGGNPLFVGALVSHLVAHGFVREGDAGWEIADDVDVADIGLPDDVRGAIGAQWAKLPPETLALLEVASVDGTEFSVDAVAAGLGCTADDVEDACHRLAALARLRQADETLSLRGPARAARYRFPHALHRRVLYDRLAPSRRRELHRRIGEHLESAYGHQAGEIAARLATHFEAAGDVERTVRYLEQAAWTAVLRHAHGAAAHGFASALAHLRGRQPSEAVQQQEAHLHLALGNALVMKEGFSSQGAVEAFAQAERLALASGAHHLRFRALIGLGSHALGIGSPRALQPHVDAMMAMAAGETPELTAQALWRSGTLHLERGEFEVARSVLERAMRTDAVPGIPAAVDLPSELGCRLGATLTHLGLFDQARAQVARAIQHTGEVGLPFAYGHCCLFAVEQRLLLRDADGVLALLDQVADWIDRYAFPTARPLQQFYRAWALHQRKPSLERVRAMHDAVRAKHAVGEHWGDAVHFAELADAHLRCGEVDGARACLGAALAHVERTDERRHEAELHRLDGELRLAAARSSGDGDDEAAAAFERAVAVARRQGAKLWELRATVSLARSLGRRGESRRARTRLARVLGGLTEGHEEQDVRSARSLLAELT